MSSINVDQELIEATEAGDAAKVSELLVHGANPRSRKPGALQWAASNGLVEGLRRLLPVSDAKADDSFALWSAAKYGHAECVKLLLPVSDPKAGESYALRMAASMGHEECVRLLLPVSGPLCEIEGVLGAVLEAGRATVAALLIEEEPRLLDGVDLLKCLAAALENDHLDMAALLSSIIDKKELLEVALNRPRSSLGLARL